MRLLQRARTSSHLTTMLSVRIPFLTTRDQRGQESSGPGRTPHRRQHCSDEPYQISWERQGWATQPTEPIQRKS